MASTIALTTLDAAVTPVVTTGKKFAGDYYKLATPNLSSIDRKVIQIISLVHGVFNALDYRSNLGAVITDAEVFMRGISNLDLETAQAVTHWALGFTADANLTTDVVAILKEGQKFQKLPEHQLDRIIAYLCTVGPV